MFYVFRKLIPVGGHIINSISRSTFPVQIQWLPARYCHSISSDPLSFTVSYLIDTCGFSPEDAASVSKYVSFQTRDKPDMVIKFLKSQGLSQPQILRCIREIPMLLRSDPGKTFLPKIEFFISRGASSSDISKLICSSPHFLKRSLNKQLIPSYDFFRGLFQSDEKLIKVLTKCSCILLDINTHAVPNMKLLSEVGVPQSNVIKLLQWFPRTLATNTGRFKMIMEELQEMGFDPLKVQFIMALFVLTSLGKSTWEKKANAYRKWGWSDNDIRVAFRKSPFCMVTSEDKIDAIMKLLVEKLGCPSSTIPNYARVMLYNLDKRIVPRASVFQVLLSKGQVKKKSLLSIFVCNERDFLNRFILSRKEEASELLKLYQAKLDLAR